MTLRARLRPAATAALLLLFALPAAAAEGGGDVLDSPLGWTFRWLNSAIVAALIGYLLVKKAPAFFRGRAESIAAAIELSGRGRQEAEQRERAAAEKLAGLEKEIAELRTGAGREMAAEAERIRAGAREEVAKIERAAQAEIAAAARAARTELKAVAARLALSSAERELATRMTPAAEGTFFRTFVRQLSGGAAGSRN